MSGIAGILDLKGAPVAQGLVEMMTSGMAYRGLDGSAHWRGSAAALGHCQFRTTRESLEETQPLATTDGSVVLVLDGRVDNYAELRRELVGCGARLRSVADAELVLHAYETWGTASLGRIDGDFALVIWDTRKREVFCARDRLGIRSLHYSWDGSRFVFASDLHAILALPGFAKRLNEGMLAEFLAAEFHSCDETLWDGVLRLEAGHCMVAGQGGLRRWRYWEPELGAPQPDPGDDERFERYRELFIDCVRRRCRSQLPVAIEVSGGLDSSAVWCAAMEASKSGGLAAPEIRAYTTTFAGDARADELAYARDVARHLRQSLHEVPGSHLPLEVVLAKGRRFSDFPGYPNSWLFWETNRKVAADGARVVLSGEGGDYWLQGSREYYAEELRRGNAQALLEVYRADWKDFGFAKASTWLLRHGVFELLPASIRFALQRLRHLRDRPTDRDEFYWLSARMRDALASRRAVSASGSAGCDPRDGQLGLWNALHSAAAMQITERAELQGALAGIEYRHPFFDHRFVQLAFTTPARLRLRGAQTKFIHRQALRTLLPPSVLRRGDKAEFSGAFRRHLDSLGNQLTGSLPATRADWVSREGMERLYRSYAGNQELGSPIWPLWGLVACDAMLEEST